MSTSLRQVQALLEFTPTDLEANRRGRLSKAQIERLELNATREMRALLVIPGVLLLWLAVAFDFKIAFPVIAVVALIILGFVGLHKDYLKGLKSRQVRKVSGQVSKKISGDFGIIQYVIHVGDERLPISQSLYDQLSEGKFDIYMLGGDILSLEPQRRTSTPTSKAKSTPKPKPKTATTPRSTQSASAPKRSTATPTKTTKATKTSASQRSKPQSKSTSAAKPTAKRQGPAVKKAKPTGATKTRQMPLTRTRSTASTTKTTRPSPNR